ncbi:hypothetical protein V7103_19830 [Neobacillus drentensis]|uniref:hypothetical protein n=1 Tax=Neobacillus drentensis TaxID=220684 RepID=UPI0030005F0A
MQSKTIITADTRGIAYEQLQGTIEEKSDGGNGDAKGGNMPSFHEGGFYMKEIAEHSYW